MLQCSHSKHACKPFGAAAVAVDDDASFNDFVRCVHKTLSHTYKFSFVHFNRPLLPQVHKYLLYYRFDHCIRIMVYGQDTKNIRKERKKRRRRRSGWWTLRDGHMWTHTHTHTSYCCCCILCQCEVCMYTVACTTLHLPYMVGMCVATWKWIQFVNGTRWSSRVNVLSLPIVSVCCRPSLVPFNGWHSDLLLLLLLLFSHFCLLFNSIRSICTMVYMRTSTKHAGDARREPMLLTNTQVVSCCFT